MDPHQKKGGNVHSEFVVCYKLWTLNVDPDGWKTSIHTYQNTMEPSWGILSQEVEIIKNKNK